MMDLCKICGTEMDDDPNSLHLNCGGDCRWCMARSGDPDCQAEILDQFRQDCLSEMSDVFKETKK